jgi:hypothetical protein
MNENKGSERITIEEVKEFLDLKGIVLGNESLYEKRKNFFNICNTLTNNKLKNMELMISNENMTGLITNQRPDLEYIHHHTQLLAIQYDYFEKLPETRGKLTAEEKIKLAFANFAIIYIDTYDLKTGSHISVLDEFETMEKFEKLYYNYKLRSMIMFAFLNENRESRELENIN